jgi:hypothetical protein
MAPLQGTVALEQMNQMAVLVAEELHLDVARSLDVLLQEYIRDPKGRIGFPACLLHCFVEVLGREGDAHAAAAAAHGGLDDYGIAEFSGQRPGRGPGADWGVATRQNGNAGLLADFSGSELISQLLEDLHSGSHKSDPRLRACPRECRILGKEAVARMDGIDFMTAGQSHDPGNIEIGTDRLTGFADRVGFIGLEPVQREPILVRVDGDSADAKLVG